MSPGPLRLRLARPVRVRAGSRPGARRQLPAGAGVAGGPARRAGAAEHDRRGALGGRPARARRPQRGRAGLPDLPGHRAGPDRRHLGGLPAARRRGRGRPARGRRAGADRRAGAAARSLRDGRHQRRAGRRMLDVEVPLVGEREDAWVLQLRRDVRRLLRRARICWSSACVELGAPDTAVQVASAALGDDPFDEQAGRTLVMAHRLAGRSGAALVAYRELQVAMSEQLPRPSAATQRCPSILWVESPAAPGSRCAAVRPPMPRVGTPLFGWTGAGHPWPAVAGSRVGSPVLAVVTGEAGIGKSALVRAFVAEPRRTGAMAGRGGLLRGRALALPAAAAGGGADGRAPDRRRRAPRAGWAPAGRAGRAVARARRAVGPVTGLRHRRAARSSNTGAAWTRWSSSSTGSATASRCCWSIEDAQHAGRSSIEALHLLAGRWAGSRAMVVVTERSSEATWSPGPAGRGRAPRAGSVDPGRRHPAGPPLRVGLRPGAAATRGPGARRCSSPSCCDTRRRTGPGGALAVPELAAGGGGRADRARR